MQSFILAYVTIVLAEFGDKSQLITLYLVGKHHRTWHMVVAMACASLLNHYWAAQAGIALYDYLSISTLKMISGGVFVLIGIFSWKHEDAQKITIFQKKMPAFFICFLCYFVSEAGDKTQVATAALAAYNHTLWSIVLGATLGMITANLPVIYLGKQFGKRIPLEKLKKFAALLCIAIGIFMLVSAFV